MSAAALDPVSWARDYRRARKVDPGKMHLLSRAGVLESQVIRERLAAGDEGVAKQHNMWFLDVGREWAHLPLGERLERLNGDLFAACRRDSVDPTVIGLEAITVSEVLAAVQAARKPQTKHLGIESR